MLKMDTLSYFSITTSFFVLLIIVKVTDLQYLVRMSSKWKICRFGYTLHKAVMC